MGRNKMSEQEINEAIAEACGWRPDKRGLGWISPHGYYAPEPDYLNDLNAMHEAEKVLLSGYWMRYCECLTYLSGKSVYASVHAKALNRAEAFLRTIGKWEETK